jgi:hypothetical protein
LSLPHEFRMAHSFLSFPASISFPFHMVNQIITVPGYLPNSASPYPLFESYYRRICVVLASYLRRTWFESTLHSLPVQIFTCALNSASFRTGAGKRPQFLNCFLLYIQVTPSLNSNELEVSSILCTIINYTLFLGMLC